MANRSNMLLSSVDLTKMTVPELKDYIRVASNKLSTARNSRYKAIAKSYKYIAEQVGTRRVKNQQTGHYETKLILGFKGMKKNQLLSRARLLQGHFKVDVYSRRAKQERKKITKKTLDNFFQRTGIRLTTDEMADFKQVAASIKDIIEKFGSDNVAKMFDYVNRVGGDRFSRTSLGSIIRQVYEYAPKGEGVEKQDLVDAVYQYIDYMLGLD